MTSLSVFKKYLMQFHGVQIVLWVREKNSLENV